MTLYLVREVSGCDLDGRWKTTHHDCRMSRPPSGGPPLPASCCRLFHWISSSSRMMVCCFLNSCRVFWCFSARSWFNTVRCSLVQRREKLWLFWASLCLPVCIFVVCWLLVLAMPPRWISCSGGWAPVAVGQLGEVWPNWTAGLHGGGVPSKWLRGGGFITERREKSGKILLLMSSM